MSLTQRGLEAVGRMLSHKHDITVKCEGTECKTDGRTIYLPALPGKITSDRLLHMIRSYLDHEVAHLTGDSDFGVLEEFVKQNGEAGRHLFNTLEDLRVEQGLADEYAGCDFNLKYGAQEAKKELEKAVREEGAQHDELSQFCLEAYYRGKGQSGPSFVESQTRQDIAQFKDELGSLSLDCPSSQSLVPLATRMIQKFRESNPDFQDPPPPPGGGDGDGDKGDGEGQNGAGGGQGGNRGGRGASDALAQAIAEEYKKHPPIDEISGQAACAHAECLEHADYKHTKSNTAWFNTIERAGGPIRQQIAMLLQSEAKVWWRRGLTSGCVDPARVADLAAGTNDRVFRRRKLHTARNTACYLLVDGSGSMSGRRMEQAMDAAAVFCCTIDAAGHKSSVGMFTSEGGSPIEQHLMSKGLTREQAHEVMRSGHAAAHTLVFRLKKWNENAIRALPTMCHARGYSGGGTPMAEAITVAGHDLLAREEDRKVMIVMCDGHPASIEHTKFAINSLEKNFGVEVAIVGIAGMDPSRCHPRGAQGCAVSNGLNDLSLKVMTRLKTALKLGASSAA